jgi:hypothetical protein
MMKKIPLLIISLLICLFFDTVNSKRIISVKPPYPEGGYSAIQENVEYPHIAVIASLEGKFMAVVEIDSEGNVTSVDLEGEKPGRSDFLARAKSGINSVKWRPAYTNGKPIASEVKFPLLFFLLRDSKGEYLKPVDEVPTFDGEPVIIIHEPPIISPGPYYEGPTPYKQKDVK